MGLALHAERPLPAALAGLDPDESRPSLAAAETLSTERARPNFYARFRRHDEADVPAAPERTGRPSGERPEIPLQGLENVVSAPESPLSPPRRGRGAGDWPPTLTKPLPPDLIRGLTFSPQSPGQARGGRRDAPSARKIRRKGLKTYDSGLGGWAPAPLDGSPSGESAGPMAAAGAPLPMEMSGSIRRPFRSSLRRNDRATRARKIPRNSLKSSIPGAGMAASNPWRRLRPNSPSSASGSRPRTAASKS